MKSLLCSVLLLCTGSLFASGLPTTPYVYVQGSAEEQVAPDTFRLGFGIRVTDKDQAKAKAAVAAKSAAVFKLLADLGIRDDAITAANLDVREQHEYDSGKHISQGYIVSRSYSVVLKDLALYPKLLDGLVDLRIDAIDSVIPSSSQAQAISAKLKQAALAQARQQAEQLAAAANAHITGVFAISPIAFGEIPQAILGGAGDMVRLEAFSVRAAKGGAPDRYVFQNLTLTERLHAIFLIEPLPTK